MEHEAEERRLGTQRGEGLGRGAATCIRMYTKKAQLSLTTPRDTSANVVLFLSI